MKNFDGMGDMVAEQIRDISGSKDFDRGRYLLDIPHSGASLPPDYLPPDHRMPGFISETIGLWVR